MKDLSFIIGLLDQGDLRKVSVIFRTLAGTRLSECGMSEPSQFLQGLGVRLEGSDSRLTDMFLLDSIFINELEKGDEAIFSTEVGRELGRKKGILGSVDSFENSLDYLLSMIDGEDEEPDDSWGEFDDEDENEEMITPVSSESSEIKEVEEQETRVPSEEKEIDEKTKKLDNDENNLRIDKYYEGMIGSVMSKLVRAYTEMYQSGYEITQFAGVVTGLGMARLSGSEVVYERTSSSDSLCRLLLGKLMVTECNERSNNAIAARIYSAYREGGGSLLYFPYKIIEFAYGRESPDGDDQESIKTYKKHSSSKNWNAYCNSEVVKSIGRLIKKCIRVFIVSTFEGEEMFSAEASKALSGFLLYLEMCLSVSALVVDWKQTNDKYGGKSIDAFKVRVCDPANVIRGDITQEILNVVFLGSTGEKPFSYPCLIKEDCFVKEFFHEFDHDKAQAKPLFAYKAFESLKNQGITPSMDNLILGMSSDGRILTNGGDGVTLNKSITHFLIAGSRAGKGVMTLNILASGISSRRCIFYLDRKPDMASTFYSICPDMFVINGGNISTIYADSYFANLNNSSRGLVESLVPDYVCGAFGKSVDSKIWNVWGDLFYLRALKLSLGILMALYTSKKCQADPNLFGQDGMMIVVDEFSNFQESLAGFFSSAVSNIPPISFEKDLAKKMSGTIKKEEELSKLDSDMKLVFNDASMYAVTWLKSLSRDLNFYDEKVKAASDSTYVPNIDIFVIGQDIDRGPIPRTTFNDMLKCGTISGRYKTSGYGAKGISDTGVLKRLNLEGNCVGYNLVNFKDGITDGFFGRNTDMGHEKYLAQTKKESKAYGRLDDKASNFAYLSSFPSSTREKIAGGNEALNINIANSAVYFKPFLVLNDNAEIYADQMFKRCMGTDPGVVWISPDVIREENPGNTETGLCDEVGMPGYLKYMGVDDTYGILKKSGDIANYVVQEVLGYDGDWRTFVMDLRIEWMFSIEDIVDALVGEKSRDKIGFFNRDVDVSFDEYNKYSQGTSVSREYTDSGRDFADLLDNEEDFTELKGNKSRSDDRLYSTFAGEDDEDLEKFSTGMVNDGRGERVLDDEEEISIMDDDSYDEDEDFYDDVDEDPPVLNHENFYYRENKAKEVLSGSGTDEEVQELMQRLAELGYSVSLRKQEDSRNQYDYSDGIEDESYDRAYTSRKGRKRRSENGKFTQRGRSVFEDTFDFSDGESIESLESVVKLITKDVIAAYGGLSRISTFKCQGGSLLINGYCYNCKLSGRAAMSLPYDLRSEIGAGCVARLFDYKTLLGMKSLRSLSFDSTEFVYDYVSTSIGYGERVSIDLFFRDIPSLKILKIGDRTFTREKYKSQLTGEDRDVFYQPRLLKRAADFTDSFIEHSFKSSWALTLDSARNKKYSKLRRLGGVAFGLSSAAVTGATTVSMKAARKGIDYIRNISRGMGKALREYEDSSKK